MSTYPAFNVFHISLNGCELKTIAAMPPDSKATFSYSADVYDLIDVPGDKEGIDISILFCRFSASKEANDTRIAEISASYMVLYTDPPRSIEKTWTVSDLAKAVASTSIWPRFCDLVGVIAAQNSGDFPKLPYAPDRVLYSVPDKRKNAHSP